MKIFIRTNLVFYFLFCSGPIFPQSDGASCAELLRQLVHQDISHDQFIFDTIDRGKYLDDSSIDDSLNSLNNFSIKEIDIIASIPLDEDKGFKNIFSRNASAKEIIDLNFAREEILNSGVNVTASNSSQSIRDFIKKPSQGEPFQKDVVILIGHNEKGMLIARDSSSLPIATIVADCQEVKKICVILSCNSSAAIDDAVDRITKEPWLYDSKKIIFDQKEVWGVDSELTYEEAFDLAKQVKEMLQRGKNINSEIISKMLKNNRIKRIILNTGILTVEGGGVIVVSVAILTPFSANNSKENNNEAHDKLNYHPKTEEPLD